MTVLLTGGAGYIGAHVLRELQESGDRVVVVDDLSTGLPDRVRDAPIEHVDLAGPDGERQLRTVIRRHEVEAVVHLAGKKRVDESLQRPTWYFQQNVGGLASVLAATIGEDVPHLVFSSSAAVYGAVDDAAVPETRPPAPVNPYGRSKLVGEWMVQDATAASHLSASSLRYFNVAGCGGPDLFDPEGTNLIPVAIDRMRRGEAPRIFGTDWPTPDGTCVRDFVHVVDLAKAHVVVLTALRSGAASPVYNVGTGGGHSVRQVLDEIARQLGSGTPFDELPRRAGDPASVVADVRLIARDLGWRSTLGLEEMISSSLSAFAGAGRP